jgi:hypothetical protein
MTQEEARDETQMPGISTLAICRSVLLASTPLLYHELPKGVTLWGIRIYSMWGNQCLTREGNVLSTEFSYLK